MKTLVAALMMFGSAMAVAAEEPVMFHVTVKDGSGVIGSPSFLAAVGQPATVRLASGISVEALAKPAESDGGAWTQVRIT